MQLLGEDIDTKVAVLAGGGRGGDADHLARAALQHEVVANADVVARDRHRVGEVGLGDVASAGRRDTGTVDIDVDVDVDVLMVVVRVDNLVSQLVQAVAEGVVVAVLVVVTHLGLLFGARVTSRLNGDVGVFLGDTLRAVLGVLGLRSRSRNVYVDLVGGTVTFAVFTLSNVNWAGVRLRAAGVNLNVRFSVLRARCRSVVVLVNVLVNEVLLLGTGTAVTFFFTRNTDLVFAVAVLSTGWKLSGGSSERRLLTFPSGLLLGWEVDANLLVGLGDLGLLVGFGFPVRRGKDAEGDWDAGLKVQVGGLGERERIFSFNLPKQRDERMTRRILRLLLSRQGEQKRDGKKGREGEEKSPSRQAIERLFGDLFFPTWCFFDFSSACAGFCGWLDLKIGRAHV